MNNNKNNRQYEMEKEMIKRVWKNLLFVGLPVFFGFMTIAISPSLGAFIMGFAGVIAIVKKEMSSGRGTVRGPIAVATGVFVTIICWGVATYFFLNGF